MTDHSTLADRVKEANSAFLGALGELEAALDTMTPVPAGELTRRLVSIRGIAADHFRLEEQDGYLNPVVTCRPELETKKRGLLDDHRHLLGALDEVIRDSDAGEGLTGDVRDRLRDWLGDVRRHEGRENEFFDEAREYEPC